jgi:carboxylesterase
VEIAEIFQEPEHQAFCLEGGVPTAVLVHGFPGTPAEMRPLGEALHGVGWTVHGALLPGFGPELETLAEQRHTDWIHAVSSILREAKAQRRPTLLVGFSMGGAVAVAAAARERPDGLVLLAPFWRASGLLWNLLPVLRHVFRNVKPFRLIKLDFSDPEVRRGIAEFFPGLDLDDPAVQQSVRDFEVPTVIFHQIRRLGQAAERAIQSLNLATLVLQGTDDEAVRPKLTREFVQHLSGSLHYKELAADHQLVNPHKPAWPKVKAAVLTYAAEFAADSGATPH